MAAHRTGQSWAVLAASEMGKGVWLKQRLAANPPKRLAVWDRNDEYHAEAQRVATLADFAKAHAGAAWSLRYVPRGRTRKDLAREFETWCLIAFECVGATLVVEELADVTTPSFAPPAWRQLNTRGRHHQGLTLYWCSQSPAMVDKAALTNATHLHVGYLGTHAHRVAVAREMNTTAEAIDALEQFEWLEYERAKKATTQGRVTLPRRRAARSS